MRVVEETLLTEVDFGDEEDSDDLLNGLGLDELGAFRIIYQTNNFFVPQFRDLIKRRHVINLRPEYQRRLRWDDKEKSRLIESLLLNIPIPPIFLYESKAARYEVMDGQQRLNAIVEFFENKFELKGLNILHDLNGKKYKECPPRVIRSLDRSAVSAIVLLMGGEKGIINISDMRRFVFNRLNTGGKQLNAQEIRNAMAPKKWNNLIIELSQFDLFTKSFNIPPYSKNGDDSERKKNKLYSSMKDCELVLRFFALRDEENIRGSIKSMLDRFMSEDKEITDADAKKLSKEYRDRFKFLYELFDEKPFRIETQPNKILASLYDSSMVALDQLWDNRSKIQSKKSTLIDRLENAASSDEKYALIAGRKNTSQSIKERISLMKKILLPI